MESPMSVRSTVISIRATVWLGVSVATLGGTGAFQPVRSQEVRLGDPSWTSNKKFTAVHSIRALDDGVIVADRTEGLLFLEWDGTEARPAARTGEGPGEMEGVGSVFPLRADSTLFVDAITRRWLLFKGSEVVETVTGRSVINRHMLPEIVGVDAGSHVVGEATFTIPRDGTPGYPDSVFLIMGDRARESLDTIARLPGDADGHQAMVEGIAMYPWWVGANPLSTRPQAVVYSDGTTAVVWHDPYHVRWRRPDGQWSVGPSIEFERTRVDRETKCFTMRNYFGVDRPNCDPSILSGWPETLPPFLPRPASQVPVVFAAPDGGVLVWRTPRAGENRPRYDLINSEGRREGVLVLQPNETIVSLAADAVFSVMEDEWGLQTLRRYPLSALGLSRE